MDFPKRKIESATFPLPIPLHKKYNQAQLNPETEDLLKQYKNNAFLILKNDSLVFEKYFTDNKPNFTNSFSVAKSILSMLVERARMKDIIVSWDQPVSDFIPAYQDEKRGRITFAHLLDMSSGLLWSESGANPFSDNAKAYYDDDLEKIVLGLQYENTLGKYFEYLSGSTQVAAYALQKALGEQKLTHFLQEELFEPLGMEDEGFWAMDRADGIEKAYCCIYTTARNFLKFGQLLLNEGKYNGKELLSEDYIERIFSPQEKNWDIDREKPNERYSLGFWHLEYQGRKVMYLSGSLGQYVVVIPEEKLVIVRTGDKKIMPKLAPKKDELDVEFHIQLALDLLAQI